MNKRVRKKLDRITLRERRARNVSVKKGMVTKKRNGYTLEKVYRIDPITGKKSLCRVTRIDDSTGERNIILNKGTNIPVPDHFPPIPSGTKPPKPDSVPDEHKDKADHKRAKFGVNAKREKKN